MNLGDRLRLLRAARGISQLELSRLTGLSGSGISHIEGGGPQPRTYNVEKLAKALEVHVDALYFDVVCFRELMRIFATSPLEVAEQPNAETALTRAARDISRQLTPAQDEHAAMLLRGMVGLQLAQPVASTPAAAPVSEEGARDAPQREPSTDRPTTGEGGK